MQNRYVGDIGDYGKYALLRSIARSSLILGVNWYLTPDERHNSDGKHISYLKSGEYSAYDEELHGELKRIVAGSMRNVFSVQQSRILPESTIYYDDMLAFDLEPHYLKRRMIRGSWHKAALDRLSECEIAFLDPDNGLQVKSVSLTGKKGNKYIGLNELKDYYKLGKSIVFYNHRERKQEEDYLDKFRKLRSEEDFGNAEWIGLKFRKGTVRDYFFILQPRHQLLVKKQFEELLGTAWKSCFSLLSL